MVERPLTRKKWLGSYYTDPRVVDFLIDWGTGIAPGAVMDPSCGDGRFLGAALRGGANRVVGCDLDQEALASATRALSGIEIPATLVVSDFFLLDPDQVGPVDLVVGNPPLRDDLGLSAVEIRRLEQARNKLVERRMTRARGGKD